MTKGKKAQSAHGDGNVQIIGDHNLVSVPTDNTSKAMLGLTRKQLLWTIIGVLIAVAAVIATLYFSWRQLQLTQRNSMPEHRAQPPIQSSAGASGALPPAGDKAPAAKPKNEPAKPLIQGLTGMKQAENSSGTKSITQIAHGNKNVQIVGNSNVVDNRTYNVTIAGNAQLTYRFSQLELRKDGVYGTLLTVASTGSMPAYGPVIHLEFDRSILEVQAKPMTASVLFNVRETYNDEKTSYTYSVNEMSPGLEMQFTIRGNAEFSITKFKINDKTII